MQGKGVSVSSMGVVRVQGMCPHEIYLGTCTCIKVFEKIYCIYVLQDEQFSKFFGPKKNWVGGVLRESCLGTYTSPTLMI